MMNRVFILCCLAAILFIQPGRAQVSKADKHAAEAPGCPVSNMP
jgi:hypothetical protein